MVPTPAEIFENLKRVVLIFRLQPGASTGFRVDKTAILQSFAPLIFLFPVFYAHFYLGFKPLATNLDTGTGMLRVAVLYVFYWALLPVIAYRLGYRQGFKTFVVARNWLLTASMLFGLFSLFGGIFALITAALSLYWYVAKWFLFKDALVLENAVATRLFFIDALAYGTVLMWYISSLGIDPEKLQLLMGQ